ncbi:MBOAT-domain-containing protein [Piedraia hortae CBS 480.64]|uniref:MBOAT-domain-containing protein n=1 Tax=Piedraia hortae CBS 480.64 TaxID=1314780 RepID=A0A6A7C4I8_9PEZI|nr:MBOAT-domain-containing protein [Piedraia hortae CBS 480.64]
MAAYVRDLFTPEALDFRFAAKNNGEPLPYSRPSRWKSTEFYCYYFGFMVVPFFMFKSVYDVSQPSHPGYKHFESRLSPGWIPGRKFDNSDAQYSSFRENVPYLALLLVLHPLLRVTISARDGFERRARFDLCFALVFLFALHGLSALKILIILTANYALATQLPRDIVPIATWVFNVAILFANELCHGYPLPKGWFPFEGLIPRWEILFNITVLRLIAYNFDYIWMLDRRSGSPLEKKRNAETTNERERVSSGALPSDFTFANYLSYTLYSPLYLAGPIINFNDYISQTRQRLPSINRERITAYALRLGFCLLTMEILLHYFYVVALCAAKPNWNMYTPFQLSMLGYFHLHVIWLKLLLPWRFFRLWSLLDGIDPPENMARCMSDNYSALAFWRAWHRSFNRWVVRYIYVPLGGTSSSRIRSVRNYLAVFTFVALWHDINLKLLIWGWLVVVFIAPEIILRTVFAPGKFKGREEVYRVLAGLGAVGNILMMMTANLVGFAIGVDGLAGLVTALTETTQGRLFLPLACACLFIGAQIMFEVRESEYRRGLDLKC